jgi:hypothetical protein
MPVSECPQCFRELEVVRPTGVADEHRDCPDCGGGVLRPISEFGSKTGTHLWPSVEPFRDEYAFAPSRRAEVATATIEEPVAADDRFEGQPTGVEVESSRTVDSQPGGRRIWSIHKWGIASLLRHFRKDADVKPAEKMQYPQVMACTMTAENGLGEVMPTMPREDHLDYASGADQRICYPSVRHRPEEGIAEPAEITESVILLPDEPVVFSDKPWWPASYVMQWPEEEPQPAVTAQSHVRASDEQATTAARLSWPRSYFGWFMFVTVVEAFTVVPLVWILGVMLT